MTWFGDPTDIAFLAMREQTWKTSISFRWMLRILNPVAALEQRGYPAGLETELELELDDALLGENSGRLKLEVAEGKGRVTKGGSGALRADVRGLASIYTGYLTPWKARRAGLLDGTDETLARAAAIFASSGEPWIADMF